MIDLNKVIQWNIINLQFIADRIYNWDEFPVQVIFEHEESGSRMLLDGFKNGRNEWVVRFAPTMPGIWRWKSFSENTGMSDKSGVLNCIRPDAASIEKNSNLRGHLKISSNGHHFVYDDNTPFFWLGDTVWNIFSHYCGLEEPFKKLIQDRKGKCFNVIQAQFFDLRVKNEGGYAFPNNTDYTGNFDELNENYFIMVDIRMEKLWEAGFVLGIHPSWVGKRMPVKAEDIIRVYRYLLARYGAFNVLWSLAGEYQYSYPCELENPYIWSKENWLELGRTVNSYNSFKHPVTVHPSSRILNNPREWPAEAHQQSSGGEFHHESWLDFNWTQTGHREDMLWFVPYRSQENYFKQPAKPVVHSEGRYENFNQWGRPCAADENRWQAWAAVLNGSCGHTYGAVGTFLFFDPDSPHGRSPGMPEFIKDVSWRDGLSSPGSTYMSVFYKFFSSIDWWTLEPHNDWIRIDGIPPDIENPSDPFCAACVYKLMVVYIPAGNKQKEIQLLYMGPVKYRAVWFNPRNGESMPAVNGAAEDMAGNGKWTAPAVPDNEDWVLYLSATE